MPWTGNQVKELWHAVQEVEYLGDKEQQGRFTEVANYSNHGKCHSWEVAKCVAHKYLSRVPETRNL